MMHRLTVGAWILVLLSGCSTQMMMVRLATPLVQGQYQAVYEEPDPELARQAVPANLKMLEGMLYLDPGNETLLLTLAEGFCNYAVSFVEEPYPQRAAAYYLRGRDFAARALTQAGGPPAFYALGLREFEAAAKGLEPAQLPALYWMTRCWGGWVFLNQDKMEALVALSKMELAMTRVLQWQETFDHAGPHLFFGVFYASRPRILGGDPEKGRLHFERNLELTGEKFLMSQVLYAKLYAVQTQDRDLFDRLLHQVLDTPADAPARWRLVNAVAKVKARALLETADDYF
ncbi:MAG: TRAP transporter TatT component family protein [Nitrospinaceae bacterium]